jgi:hypothetical protein
MHYRITGARALLSAGVILAFTTPALAAGIGGISIGGIGGAVGGVAGTVGGAVNSAGGGAAPGSGDGPSGQSASSGRSPFAGAKASKNWSAIPSMDPTLPGLAVPAALPDVSVDPAGTTLNSSSMKTGRLGSDISKAVSNTVPSSSELNEDVSVVGTVVQQEVAAEQKSLSGPPPQIPPKSSGGPPDVNDTVNSTNKSLAGDKLVANIAEGLATSYANNQINNSVNPIASDLGLSTSNSPVSAPVDFTAKGGKMNTGRMGKDANKAISNEAGQTSDLNEDVAIASIIASQTAASEQKSLSDMLSGPPPQIPPKSSGGPPDVSATEKSVSQTVAADTLVAGIVEGLVTQSVNNNLNQNANPLLKDAGLTPTKNPVPTPPLN